MGQRWKRVFSMPHAAIRDNFVSRDHSRIPSLCRRRPWRTFASGVERCAKLEFLVIYLLFISAKGRNDEDTPHSRRSQDAIRVPSLRLAQLGSFSSSI